MPYVKPTLSELIAQVENTINVSLGTTEASLQFSYLNAIADSTAGALNGIYSYQDYIAKNAFPDTADSENLSRWAGIWGVPRDPATKSTGTVLATGVLNAFIAKGTELKRTDDVRYITTADALMPVANEISIPVESVKTGADTDVEINAVEGIDLTFITPPTGVASTAVVETGGIGGGDPEETDESLLEKLLDRIQTPPHGGNSADYITWAKEVEDVTRAWEFHYPDTELGSVRVLFMTDNDTVDGFPEQAKIDETEAYINTVRPVTVKQFTADAPIKKIQDFTLQVVPATLDVQENVTKQLQSLFLRDASPGSTIRLSNVSEAISLATGEEYHYILSPTQDIDSDQYELLTVGAITFV
jgi:uncharacterized phage protein gp47/JayE